MRRFISVVISLLCLLLFLSIASAAESEADNDSSPQEIQDDTMNQGHLVPPVDQNEILTPRSLEDLKELEANIEPDIPGIVRIETPEEEMEETAESIMEDVSMGVEMGRGQP